MSEPSKIIPLPARAGAGKLRDTTLDLARRLDALIGTLENEAGYAELRIIVERGIPKKLYVERSFLLDQ